MRKLATLAIILTSSFAVPSPAGAYSGAFLSFPKQPCTTSVSGTNVVVAFKTWQGCFGKVALTVHNATNVYLHDLDFADNGGDIYLVDVTGQVRIENVRARNTGDGTIGSGHGNVIQLSRTFDNGTGGIRHVKALGGDTEDMISIYKSGGTDATHPLVIADVHLESPLPPNSLAWSSGSGTCINLADGGGHDIILRNSTFLNCGQVGIQMNQPVRVLASQNIVYGAARSGSNVGLSRFGSCSTTCAGNKYARNRVWWVKANGSASPTYICCSDTAMVGNVTQDTTIDPNALHVTL